jgi:hypothetical protein
MSEVKYGQLENWEEGAGLQNDFMKLLEGDNVVRVVTNPYQFVVHWVKDSNGANKRIRCSIKDCPLCKQGIKSQFRWYIGVINRKTKNAEILEISHQIYEGIKGYAKSPDWNVFHTHEWGKVMGYDINIRRGAKGANPLYNVIASPKHRNLTDDEAELVKAFFERVAIEKFTQPSTPEDILEKVGSLSGVSAPQYAVGTKTVSKPVSKPMDSGSNGSRPVIRDEDFDFGDEQL